MRDKIDMNARSPRSKFLSFSVCFVAQPVGYQVPSVVSSTAGSDHLGREIFFMLHCQWLSEEEVSSSLHILNWRKELNQSLNLLISVQPNGKDLIFSTFSKI
jgi:hypothetical protein